MIMKICSQYDIMTALLCAKFPTTEKEAIRNCIFFRVEFKTHYGQIMYFITSPAAPSQYKDHPVRNMDFIFKDKMVVRLYYLD